MEQIFSDKKKLMILIGAVLGAVVCICLLLVVTAPSRIEGRWECNVGYLPAYGREGINTMIFSGDGTYLNVVTDANTGEILSTSTGSWTISGLKVKCRRLGQKGTMPFTYNPVTNIMNNGGGLFPQPSDVIFERAS